MGGVSKVEADCPLYCMLCTHLSTAHWRLRRACSYANRVRCWDSQSRRPPAQRSARCPALWVLYPAQSGRSSGPEHPWTGSPAVGTQPGEWGRKDPLLVWKLTQVTVQREFPWGILRNYKMVSPQSRRVPYKFPVLPQNIPRKLPMAASMSMICFSNASSEGTKTTLMKQTTLTSGENLLL